MLPIESESDTALSLAGHHLALLDFRAALEAWGDQHRRFFPWRVTNDPFHILMAEMMLRRTQARQVETVYKAFIEQFPDAQALAAAPKDEVKKALHSLGLAWRVPAFQHLAQVLVEQHGGQVPTSYKALAALLGVGDYVAGAVCCFAFGQALILADTNTVRVAGRIFNIPTHAESRRRQPMRKLLHALLDERSPRAYNYALLDLAALVCLPKAPLCQDCPIACHCATGRSTLNFDRTG